MSGARQFRYAPAALARPVAYTLDGHELTTEDHGRIDLSSVTGAAFVNHVLRGARLIRLDIWTGAIRHSLSYTGNAKTWRADPDAATFLRLVHGVLTALDPSMTVTLGERGGSRAAMFAIGLAAAIGGVGIFGAALATGVWGPRLAAAAVPMGLLTVLGTLLGWAYAPWRADPTATPTALAGVIGGIISGLAAPETAD